MIKVILIGLAILIVAFVVIVAMQPGNFRIVRKTIIGAPPGVVFPQVNNLSRWSEWSPWAKLDPTMQQTYEGPPAGRGAVSRWSGNNRAGEGIMTITECRPSDYLGIKLEFVRPFPCTNAVEFAFQPEGAGTAVTWSMTGRNNFIAKAAGLCMDMDKMVGGQFEEGLASLKVVAEASHRSETGGGRLADKS